MAYYVNLSLLAHCLPDPLRMTDGQTVRGDLVNISIEGFYPIFILEKLPRPVLM